MNSTLRVMNVKRFKTLFILGSIAVLLMLSWPICYSYAPIKFSEFPRLRAGAPMAPQSSTLYDEQIAATFTQNFPSLAYTVTAAGQTGTDGYGPAYLMNGLGNTGYWYQVGLSDNWEPGEGFRFNYEVWNPAGNSVFPANGGGGLISFSGQVNQGDTVLLSLNFANGNVLMQGIDQNTGASGLETYTAAGATQFVGSSSAPENSQGYFTGLMTEGYHSAPYYGDEQKEIYNANGPGITSAWMWIEEFSVSQSGVGSLLFSDYTHSPVTFTGPTQLQTFSSNGATESIGETQFITGGLQTPSIALTFNFSIIGGGVPSAPVLTYINGGAQQSAALSQSGQTFAVDSGSSWSVTSLLSSSSPNERWETLQTTSGVAGVPQTVTFIFYHQYLVTFNFQVIGFSSGYSAPAVTCRQFGSQITPATGTPIWADASQYTYSPSLPGSSSGERWFTNSSSGLISSSGSISAVYYHQFLMTVDYSLIGGGTPASPALNSTAFGSPFSQTLSAQSQEFWLDAAAAYSLANPLTGSTASERWQSNSVSEGSVSSSFTLAAAYEHQYYVVVNLDPDAGGSNSAGDGWFDAGTPFYTTATANTGWQFEAWSGTGEGSYSGTNDFASAVVNAPLTETAVFFPGLVINASSNIAVAYTYGTTTGSVPAGTSGTVFAPPGTNLEVTAKPALFIYSFGGWTGASVAGSSTIAIVLNSPANLTGSFKYNYINIGIVIVALIAIVVFVLIMLRKRN